MAPHERSPFRAGDTLRVNVRVKEGDKERIQAFEGVCIARRGSGVSETFTVRKISNGVGVERIFPVHSPMLAEISVVRRGRVRRAKLYYLRHLTGKATRIREKKVRVAVPETGTPARVSRPVALRACRALEPIERDLRRTRGPLIAGVDEVGRGPSRAPSSHAPSSCRQISRAIPGVDDSKDSRPPSERSSP